MINNDETTLLDVKNTDTANRYLVGMLGGRIYVSSAGIAPMKPADALVLAAWLTAVAEVQLTLDGHTDEQIEQFTADILETIRNT